MQLLKRVSIYIVGLFVLCVGVAFSAHCGLGASPIGTVPLAISQSFNLNLGICSALAMFFCVFLQIAMLRSKYKWINIFQVFTAVFFGLFVSLAEKALLFVFPEDPVSYIYQLLYLFVSIICIASGVYLYLKGRLLNLPADSVFVVIHQKFGINIGNSKVLFDFSYTVLAVLICLSFMGEVTCVREGTLISVLLVGKCIGILNKLCNIHIEHFINGHIGLPENV